VEEEEEEEEEEGVVGVAHLPYIVATRMNKLLLFRACHPPVLSIVTTVVQQRSMHVHGK
jgi:hypothetical protein